MLEVPLIDKSDVNDLTLLSAHLRKLENYKIDHVNWPLQYPSKPDVFFKIAHNGYYLFLQFFVEEDEVLAKTKEDNGPVWTDSCVEFFISFDNSPYYYNLELSCIGTALFGYRKERKDVVYGNSQIMDSIKRCSTLGSQTFEKKQGDFKWELLVVIPVSAFWKTRLTSFSGVEASGNFYKCGDHLTVPHYLSWNPIETETPNFHMPNYFGELFFK